MRARSRTRARDFTTGSAGRLSSGRLSAPQGSGAEALAGGGSGGRGDGRFPSSGSGGRLRGH